MNNSPSKLTPARNVVVDGVSINYTWVPQSSNSPIVVLIHGFGASLETWSDISPLLCKKNSVVRIDLKGSGFSSRPKDGDYSPSTQARIVLRFLNHIGVTNAILVGHSLGGGVALLTYFQSLEPSTNISIHGLVLIDGAGYRQQAPFFMSFFSNPLTRSISHLLPASFQTQFVLQRIMKVREQITPERIDRYAFFLKQPGNIYALSQTSKDALSEDAFQLEARYPEIPIPTLIIWGEDDPVISVENARRFNKDIPNSQLIVFQRTGHIPHEERPTQTFRAIQAFLERIK